MQQYPLAKNGIYRTIQGEGALMGMPSIFLRLGGCSVGCKECDTDYRVERRLTAAEIRAEVRGLLHTDMKWNNTEWIWVTGGEPADHTLFPLLSLLKAEAKIALATSGGKKIEGIEDVTFLSVSPHGKPSDLLYTRGAQINLVPSLNGLRLADWESFDSSQFTHKWVTPCDGKSFAAHECVEWVKRHPGWRVGVQAHKTWGVA